MKFIGILFMLLAVPISVVPQYTNCSAQGHALELPNGRTVDMKCHWTARAMPAVGIPLFLLGGMMLIFRQREAALALSALGVILGIFTILLPTWLIGVCASDLMLCNIAMKPTLVFSGMVAAATGAAGIVLAARAHRL